MKRLAILAALASAACGPTVKRISMEPAQVQISTKGASVQVHATARDEKDQAIPDVQITWASSDAAVAAVDATGKVTAAKSGSATVTATAGEIKGTAAVKVSIPSSLAVLPPEITLMGIGQASRLQAAVKDDAGNPVVGQPVMYTSSDPNIAAVDNGGNVRSIGPGTATITARTGALTATSKVMVSMPEFDKIAVTPKGPVKLKMGKSEHLTAAVTNKGAPVMGVSAKWSSDNAQVATVTAAGDVMGVKKGKAKITATAGAKSESVPVMVQ
jgi:uncharacterized protein YjdB